MKRLFFVLTLFLLVPAMSLAQDFPRFEIFGGYSAQRLGISDEDLDTITSAIEDGFSDIGAGYASSVSSSRFLKEGFEGAFTVNVNSVFGIAFDVRYNKDDIVTGSIPELETNASIAYEDLSILAGPRFAIRNNKRITPFAHALFGLDRGKVTGSITQVGESAIYTIEEESDGIGIAIGGGFDLNLGDSVAIRLAQVDYYLTHHYEEFLKNVSFSAGIVFRFGWDY